MKILSSGQSIFGAAILFEHDGIRYSATGRSRGEILSRIEDAIAKGDNLSERFFIEGDQSEEDSIQNDSEPETVEIQNEAESKPKKGVKSRG